jgi:hypothetical protein
MLVTKIGLTLNLVMVIGEIVNLLVHSTRYLEFKHITVCKECGQISHVSANKAKASTNPHDLVEKRCLQKLPLLGMAKVLISLSLATSGRTPSVV